MNMINFLGGMLLGILLIGLIYVSVDCLPLFKMCIIH